VGRGLPKKWSSPESRWRFELPSQGVGGIAASEEMVVVSSRDRSDTKDVFFILDAELGGLVAQLQYDAPGQLDYGNSPRATPVLTEDAIYLQGAMGHLHCIDSITGEIRWKKHLIDDLGGQLPIWGFTASPLLIDGRLIVQPGGLTNSITALDASTGRVIWSTTGKKAAYASPVLLEIGRTKQIIAFDEDTLGGWSLSDGKRLWALRPKVKGDFNVPTPVVTGNQIVLVSENNAARVYDVNASGMISNTPNAESDALAGDSHTPIVLGDFLVGVDGDLVVLDVKNKLNKLGTFSDQSLLKYTSVIADEDRVLVACGDGTVILVRIQKDSIDEIGRFSVLDDDGELLSHPALVNGVLYVRGTTWIDAYQWK
jgi:outer membrane protein assembly factor BamB